MSIKLYQRFPKPFQWHFYFDGACYWEPSNPRPKDEQVEAEKIMQLSDGNSCILDIHSHGISGEIWFSKLQHDNAIWMILRHLEDTYNWHDWDARLSAVEGSIDEKWEFWVATYFGQGRCYYRGFLSIPEIQKLVTGVDEEAWEDVSSTLLECRKEIKQPDRGYYCEMVRQGLDYSSL